MTHRKVRMPRFSIDTVNCHCQKQRAAFWQSPEPCSNPVLWDYCLLLGEGTPGFWMWVLDSWLTDCSYWSLARAV